ARPPPRTPGPPPRLGAFVGFAASTPERLGDPLRAADSPLPCGTVDRGALTTGLPGGLRGSW
ncbi:hypothetical protein ACFWIZ_37715, partial [Streptomyces sp. NPDC127044]